MSDVSSIKEISGAEWISNGKLYVFDPDAQTDPKTWIYYDVGARKPLPILRGRVSNVLRKVEASKKVDAAIAEYLEWKSSQAEIAPKKKVAARRKSPS